MPFVCDGCKPVFNLVRRKKRAGLPTNMDWQPCDDCRALYRAHPRKSRARGAPVPDEVMVQRLIYGHGPSTPLSEPDEMMVQRLIYGPDPSALPCERNEAALILLKRGHEMSHEIAARVGLSRRTVERIAAAHGLNNPKPRAEVELGASETRAELWQLLHRGHSISGAARSVGVCSGTADRHVKKLREIGVL